MFPTRTVRLHRIAAWMACLALLFSALSPVVARVMLAAQPDSTLWLEVCTATGMKKVAIDPGAAPGDLPPGGAAVGAECPFCLLHATAGLPAPVVAPVLIAPPARRVPPHDDARAYRQTGPAWTLGSPRAPPIHG